MSTENDFIADSKRSRIDTLLEVLTLASVNGGIPPTQLMYDARLSFGALKEQLKYCLDNDLLTVKIRDKSYSEINRETAYYHATEKGFEAAKLWKRIQALIF